MNENTPPHRGYLVTVFACRCPRCREGKLFKNKLAINLKRNMEMNKLCPVCDQPSELEVGFYYGTGYVSYLIALVFTGLFLALWALTIGFSFSDKRFLFWIITNAILLVLLQPWLMRFARSLWLSWFVKYDADWKNNAPETPERVNADQQNNW